MATFGRRFSGFGYSALAALFLLMAVLLPARAQETFTEGQVVIVTKAGARHPFTVELALTPRQRAQGLMNRKTMAPDRGMLFDFGETRQVLMWMKDTYLPLDMLFIDESGQIRTIKQNAEPLSESIIDSKTPIAYVIELNAGTTENLKIRPGDKVESSVIGKGGATP